MEASKSSPCLPFLDYNPSYIVSQNSQIYGGHQEDYLNRSQEIINNKANRIIQARDNGEDLEKLFFEIIQELSAERAQIAKDHGTTASEDFGFRRENGVGFISSLPMGGPYLEYGKKILKFIAPYLMKMDCNGQFQKEMTVEREFNGSLSTVTFKIRTDEEREEEFAAQRLFLLNYLLNTNHQDLINDLNGHGQKITENKNTVKFAKESPEAHQQLKEKNIYNQFSMFDNCPQKTNEEPLFVRVTFTTEIDKKRYRMTDYFTWMYVDQEWVKNKNPEHHPVQRMMNESRVVMLHHDVFLVKETLKGISKIFARNVLWNKETQSLQDLKDSMALMTHLLAHNMRDARGTSAEDEWLERIVYKSLGIACMQNQADQSVDLEALANPFIADFRDEYDKMTKLTF